MVAFKAVKGISEIKVSGEAFDRYEKAGMAAKREKKSARLQLKLNQSTLKGLNE